MVRLALHLLFRRCDRMKCEICRTELKQVSKEHFINQNIIKITYYCPKCNITSQKMEEIKK